MPSIRIYYSLVANTTAGTGAGGTIPMLGTVLAVVPQHLILTDHSF